MTARTAQMHDSSELEVIFADDRQGIFKAFSTSSTNTYMVHFDPETNGATCDCPAGLLGRYSCWHLDHVESAFKAEMLRQEVEEVSTRKALDLVPTETLVGISRGASERLNAFQMKTLAARHDALVVKVCRKIMYARTLQREEQMA